LVESLPGWNQPLPTPWYSGYLHYELGSNRTVHTHYTLILAEDDWNHNKPVIYWSSECSSVALSRSTAGGRDVGYAILSVHASHCPPPSSPFLLSFTPQTADPVRVVSLDFSRSSDRSC
jgi:hypothetical protein